MLGRVKQFPVQAFRLPVRAVPGFGSSVPERVVLGGIGQVPGITQPERIAAFQVPETAHGIGKDDPVICHILQVSADRILQDPGNAALGRGNRQGDRIRLLVIVCLRIAEIVLLPE